MKRLEHAHGIECFFAQLIEDSGMAVLLIQETVAVQRFVHFLIAGEVLGICRAKLPRGFAFGEGVVDDAVFGHQFGGQMGEGHGLVAKPENAERFKDLKNYRGATIGDASAAAWGTTEHAIN